MAVEYHIECTHCGRAIIPRLWFYGGTLVTYNRIQHLCPFCGTVLFETGGGMMWKNLISLLIIFGVCGLLILYALNKYSH